MEGTAAHEMAEVCAKNNFDPDILVGKKAKNGIVFTTEMAEHVKFYIQTIIQDASKHKVQWEDIHFETKFNLTEIDPDAFGTCDAHFVQPFGRLVVYDLKYGAGVSVSAENNLQMQYYALGALMGEDVTEIEMVIVQPRTEEKVKRWTVTPDQMAEYADKLKTAITTAKQPEAELKDGTWCKWCPALATCPHVAKKVIEVAQNDFASPLPVPGQMTLPQIKLVLDKAELLTDWVGAVENYAQSLIQAGTTIEGWKLVPKRAHRKWTDELGTETALIEFGDKIYDRKLKTPKQMEAVAGKEKVAELSHTPDNGMTLAKDTDEREEAKAEFSKIEKPVKQITKKEAKNGKQTKKSNDTDFQSIFS
jgi:hypothetical protein